MTFADLVQRSAELKRELLEFSDHPRFDRERRQVLREHLRDRILRYDHELTFAIDYFVLQHKVRGGTTVLERFIAGRPDLSETERELLLGWRDVVEGAFEVRRPKSPRAALRRLVTKPGAAHVSSFNGTPNPVSGSWSNIGTTTMVGSLGIPL